MRVLAVCARSFFNSVRRAAGVYPLVCPPRDLAFFAQPGIFEYNDAGQPYDFLYFKLHGLPSQPFWYGDGWVTAVSAEQLKAADLRGKVVFVANCWLPESPMLAALLAAGARAVIGGSGPNYAGAAGVTGADLLGAWIRLGLTGGLSISRAFSLARVRVSLGVRTKANKDALTFQIWENRNKR